MNFSRYRFGTLPYFRGHVKGPCCFPSNTRTTITYLHVHRRLKVQALPVDSRPTIEELRHKGDVVEIEFAVDVARADERCQSYSLGPRYDQARSAEVCPFLIFVGKIAFLSLEAVVELLVGVVTRNISKTKTMQVLYGILRDTSVNED